MFLRERMSKYTHDHAPVSLEYDANHSLVFGAYLDYNNICMKAFDTRSGREVLDIPPPKGVETLAVYSSPSTRVPQIFMGHPSLLEVEPIYLSIPIVSTNRIGYYIILSNLS